VVVFLTTTTLIANGGNLMAYPITDSVLRRHYEQHLAAGGAELAGVSLDAAGSYASSATSAGASAAGQASGSYAYDAPADTKSSSGAMGFLKILIPVIVVALLAWLAMNFMGGQEQP